MFAQDVTAISKKLYQYTKDDTYLLALEYKSASSTFHKTTCKGFNLARLLFLDHPSNLFPYVSFFLLHSLFFKFMQINLHKFILSV